MRAERWVFIGDSITDTGRREDPEGYGNGYVSRIREQLLVDDPACPIEVLNRGVSGDTVRQLAARWQSDALDLRPDLLSVKIGVNDVWRGFGDLPEEAVGAEEYAATLRELLASAQASGCRLVLVTPFLVEPDRTDPMRLEVENRARIVAGLASEFGAALVDLQPAFDAADQCQFSGAVGRRPGSSLGTGASADRAGLAAGGGRLGGALPSPGCGSGSLPGAAGRRHGPRRRVLRGPAGLRRRVRGSPAPRCL